MTKVRAHATKHGMNYAKLLGAITALTTAFSGYINLEEQNEMMLQALGSKLNKLSDRVSHLEGHAGVPLGGGGTALVEAVGVMEAPIARLPLVSTVVSEATSVEIEDAPQMQIHLDAYEDVPLSMDGLKAMKRKMISESSSE